MKDDPQFDDMLANIEAYRRERDAQMEEFCTKKNIKLLWGGHPCPPLCI
jgi:hypothetical protein